MILAGKWCILTSRAAGILAWAFAYPLPIGHYGYDFTTIDINGQQINVYEEKTDIIRTFEDAVQAFASYPIFQIVKRPRLVLRITYSYRVDRYSTYYDYDYRARCKRYW
jgi:hypothetical protein